MSFASIILVLVTLQRLGELVIARANTRKLLGRGAIEVGANHYPLVVLVHAAWLIALWIWGRDQDVNLVALAAFAVLQGFILFIAVVYALVNLVVDLGYGVIDPRLRTR